MRGSPAEAREQRPLGNPLSDLAFSLFRLAAISQGVYKRGLDGNASSPDAVQRGAKARQLAETGWAVAQRG